MASVFTPRLKLVGKCIPYNTQQKLGCTAWQKSFLCAHKIGLSMSLDLFIIKKWKLYFKITKPCKDQFVTAVFNQEQLLYCTQSLYHLTKRNQAILQRRPKRVVDEYKCRECDCNFSAYEDFVSHLRQVHNDHRFVCHICAKIFKLRGSLLVHLRVVHNPLGKKRSVILF